MAQRWLQLKVNGRLHTLATHGRALLLDYLRDTLA